MMADQIFAALKKIAPSVSFGVIYTPDPYFVWDGDAPDPEEDGYEPVDVEVKATTIHQGNTLSGSEYLGGHYIKDEDPNPDISGYLPQMLREAASMLIDEIPSGDPKRIELLNVDAFLKQEMQDRYGVQRSEKTA